MTPTTSAQESSLDDVVAKTVKIGRLVAALELEKRVIGNGVLPASPLIERAALVQGVLQGELETGHYDTAIQAVYTPGTPERALFNGNFCQFADNVIAAVKASKRKVDLACTSVEIILENWSPDQVYDLAMADTLKEETAKALLEDPRPGTRKSEGLKALGDRYFNQGKYVMAKQHYTDAGDQSGLARIYAKLLGIAKDMEPKGANDAHLLMTLAQELPAKETNIKEVAQALLVHIARGRESEYLINIVYGACKKNGVTLPPAEQTIMDRWLLENMTRVGEGQLNEPWIKEWMLRHYKQQPASAYRILAAANHTGPELVEAARQGLLHRTQGEYLSVTDVAPAVLEKVYKAMPFERKKEIAQLLKDPTKLLALSKTAMRSPEVHCNDRLRTAYQLWFEGNGSPTDPFITKVRQARIKEDARSGPSGYWLAKGDTVGTEIVYQQALQSRPDCAYEIAVNADAPRWVDLARATLVENDPAFAVEFFNRRDDKIGLSMATTALAARYGLAEKDVAPYVAQFIDARKPVER